MKPNVRSLLMLGLPALLTVAGCGVDVQEAERGKRVEIKSPIGQVLVRTDVANPDTGLPVFPGAQPLRASGDSESAHVAVSSAWFGVKVVAAKYESTDEQDRIVAFYRQQMQSYGDVTECRGDVDFRRGRPVCTAKSSTRDIQLVTGTEDRQRVVVVKPRGNGTEFSLVYVNAQG
jgi:hypothetical protein